MIWGTFTDVHLATLAFALLFIVILYNVLQKKSRSGQILALFVLSFIPIGGVAYNLFTSEDMMAALPLELWSISALLLPVAAGSDGLEVERMSQYMIDEYRRIKSGEQPLYEVSLEMLERMA